jgi:cation-transporting ATPase E
VFVGLALIVFVEPPTKWLAVTQEQSQDRRPTILALVLAAVFVVLTVVQPLGDLFALTPLAPLQWALVAATFVAWFFVMRQTWRWRLIERFVGA